MDQTDIKTPNPCILTPEEQQKLLALLKKTNVKLGTVNLLTAPSALVFSSNFNVAGINVDLASVINLLIGLKIAGVAPAGNVLRGNGTNFISAILAEADLSFTDITTNNVSSTKHGFAPKALADATKYLNSAATPAYVQVKDSDLSVSDITTNNVSISLHGFTPKAPNDTTKFLRGDASWAISPFPLVQISGNAIAQTGAVASICSFTTGSSGGSFEIGGYIDVTAFTAGTISLLCDYTDPSGNAKTLTVPLVSLAGAIGTTVGSLTDVHALIISLQTSGANSIKLYTSVTSFTGTYNVYGWVKQVV
jgi:hypothetical protein